MEPTLMATKLWNIFGYFKKPPHQLKKLFRWILSLRLVYLDTLKDTIMWTYRSWRSGYPVPAYGWDKWHYVGLDDTESFRREMGVVLGSWGFLRPFFRSRGYTLYTQAPLPNKIASYLLPDPAGPDAHPAPSHPYARRAFDDDRELVFHFITPRVWPGRDSQGRDVILKLVSGRHQPSNELLILQKLNTPSARADPRNHTIHVLEFITFDGLVFAVMPRWPMALDYDFGTVTELLHCAENILEVFEFLHENRIAHNDFLSENCGVNVLADSRATYLPNLRESGVRYALYDFGASFMLPPDTDIDNAMVMPLYVGEEPGKQQHPLFNPFHGDIEKVGSVMGCYVRVLETFIPSLGPFFDCMTSEEPGSRPSASQALVEFRKIRSSLTSTQLSTEITGRLWDKGRIFTKAQYPLKLPKSLDSLY